MRWCAFNARKAAVLGFDEVETRLDAAALRDLPSEISLRLLGGEIQRRGGPAPRLDRLERAAEVVAQALAEGAPKRITLAGLSIRVNNREVTLTSAPPRSRGRGKPGIEPRVNEEEP